VSVEINTEDLGGSTMFDLFGGSQFPTVGEDGTLTLTLGTQSFYWLHVGDSHFSGGRS
jgi:maltose alpha-D-glucosyltransferase/alpha-amylase